VVKAVVVQAQEVVQKARLELQTLAVAEVVALTRNTPHQD
jgi:hypothetical protein